MLSQVLEPSFESGGACAVGADVAAQLVELVRGHEDAVAVAVLDLEVVARDARDRLGVEAGEAADAVVGVDDDVARAQLGEGLEARARRVPSGRSARRRRSRRWSGITASFSCGAMKPSRRRACANQSALADRACAVAVDERAAAGARGCRRRARPRRGGPRRPRSRSPSARASPAPARPRVIDARGACRRPARGTGAAGPGRPPRSVTAARRSSASLDLGRAAGRGRGRRRSGGWW